MALHISRRARAVAARVSMQAAKPSRRPSESNLVSRHRLFAAAIVLLVLMLTFSLEMSRPKVRDGYLDIAAAGWPWPGKPSEHLLTLWARFYRGADRIDRCLVVDPGRGHWELKGMLSRAELRRQSEVECTGTSARTRRCVITNVCYRPSSRSWVYFSGTKEVRNTSVMLSAVDLPRKIFPHLLAQSEDGPPPQPSAKLWRRGAHLLFYRSDPSSVLRGLLDDVFPLFRMALESGLVRFDGVKEGHAAVVAESDSSMPPPPSVDAERVQLVLDPRREHSFDQYDKRRALAELYDTGSTEFEPSISDTPFTRHNVISLAELAREATRDGSGARQICVDAIVAGAGASGFFRNERTPLDVFAEERSFKSADIDERVRMLSACDGAALHAFIDWVLGSCGLPTRFKALAAQRSAAIGHGGDAAAAIEDKGASGRDASGGSALSWGTLWGTRVQPPPPERRAELQILFLGSSSRDLGGDGGGSAALKARQRVVHAIQIGEALQREGYRVGVHRFVGPRATLAQWGAEDLALVQNADILITPPNEMAVHAIFMSPRSAVITTWAEGDFACDGAMWGGLWAAAGVRSYPVLPPGESAGRERCTRARSFTEEREGWAGRYDRDVVVTPTDVVDAVHRAARNVIQEKWRLKLAEL